MIALEQSSLQCVQFDDAVSHSMIPTLVQEMLYIADVVYDRLHHLAIVVQLIFGLLWSVGNDS